MKRNRILRAGTGIALSIILSFGSLFGSSAVGSVYASDDAVISEVTEDEAEGGETEGAADEASDRDDTQVQEPDADPDVPEEGKGEGDDIPAEGEETESPEEEAVPEEGADAENGEEGNSDETVSGDSVSEVSVSANDAEDEDCDEGGDEGVVRPEDGGDSHRSAEKIWIASIDDSGFIYKGEAYKPEPHVYDGEEELVKGRDYTLSWKNGLNAYTVEDKDAPSFEDAEKAPRVIVSMKGGYSKTTSVYYNVYPKNVLDSEIDILETTLIYTGGKLTYTPVVTYRGKNLKNGTDFTFGVEEGGNIRKLTDAELTGVSGIRKAVEITVAGKGNFTGRKKCYLYIDGTGSVLDVKKLTIAAIPAQQYTGQIITSVDLTKKDQPYKISVKYKKNELTEGVHYTVKDPYNAVLPGRYGFIISGTGTPDADGNAFTGSRVIYFNINKAPISKASVEGFSDSLVYSPLALTDGEIRQSGVILKLNGITIPSDGYDVTYRNANKAGRATMTFTGKNGYTGKKSVSYKIIGTDIAGCNLPMFFDTEYSKGGAKPELLIMDSAYSLVEGRDYTVSFSMNKKVTTEDKPAKYVVRGKGFYSGRFEGAFKIVPALFGSVNDIQVTAADKIMPKRPGQYTTKVTVKDKNGKTLSPGVDYDKNIVYTDPYDNVLDMTSTVNVGDIIYVKVTGKGNYTADTITTYYRILESGKDISKATVSIKSQIYKGYDVPVEIPDSADQFSVKLGGKVLELNNDFYVQPGSYANNTKRGTATVLLCGMGEYGGTKTARFTIKPKETAEVKPVKKLPLPESYLVVTDFGAIPDDGSDDTAAINSAIVAASTDDANHHTVYFPAGVYNIGASGSILLASSNVTLMIDYEATLYMEAKGSDGYNCILIRGTNVKIFGGKLDGERFRHLSGGNIGQFGMGISIDNGKNITIQEMEICNNRGDGIYINDGGKTGEGRISNVTIKDCKIHDNSRNNIGVIRCDYLTVDGCDIYHDHDGVSPMAGIDLEPDMSVGHVVENKKINHVVIKNCKIQTYNHFSAHQQANGWWAYYGVMIIYGFGEPVVNDVTIQSCDIWGDVSIGSSSGVSMPGTNVHGQVIDGDC